LRIVHSWRGERRPKTAATSLALAALTLLIVAATALAAVGQLTQLPGTAGCVSDTGSGGTCADGKALFSARAVAVSPGGSSVYVASYNSMAIFRRDSTTGRLTQLPGTAGCVSRGGSGGACAVARAFKGPTSVTVSPDGENVYVASGISDAVVVFARNAATGALTQLVGTAGCVSPTEPSCAVGKALTGANSVAVSPGGNNVYVASNQSDAVAAFRRDTSTGELTQLDGLAGCVKQASGECRPGRALDGANSVAVSSDGASVYVASKLSDAVVALRRNTATGVLFQGTGTGGCVSETGSDTCTDGKALDGAFSVAVSSNGESVYVASYESDALAVFRRDAETSILFRIPGTAACLSENGSGGQCSDGKALNGPVSVAVSLDGKSVYVSSFLSEAVAAFVRNGTDGTVTQLVGTAGCVSESGTNGRCVNGKALAQPMSVAVTPGGKHAYVASMLSNAVAAFSRQLPP
jgi:DNA-binding beta-propeller fold protein YncE